MFVNKTKAITCNCCGKPVSTPVPKETIIRAWIQCPECLEKEDTNSKKQQTGDK